jgi:hydroxymethylglutaryl-CoA reductase (NADPH)
MSSEYTRVRSYVQQLLQTHSREQLIQKLIPKRLDPPPAIPRGSCREHLIKRLELLHLSPEDRRHIADPRSVLHHDHYRHNVENYIGTAKIPIGLAGPLRVNGLFAQGDYYVPLATTEAALVASYHRGARLITRAGGCTAMLLNEGVGRAPGFVFSNLIEVGKFAVWVQGQFERFEEEASQTTRHGKLVNMKLTVEGNHVYLNFEFTTGDAAGQNMVTIATEAICSYIRKNSPVKPRLCFVEANLSGDKKASIQSFQSVRGKKVTAEVTIESELIREHLHTTSQKLVEYWRISAIGGALSSTIGLQGQYANGLAALYLACGQDVACVAESSVGLTRFEITGQGHLYASVTLPNLMVGTVGGGTGLPTQKAGLRIMGLAGPGRARAFAEVCAALCLGGELSIIGAMCASEFTKAHRLLARHSRADRISAHKELCSSGGLR